MSSSQHTRLQDFLDYPEWMVPLLGILFQSVDALRPSVLELADRMDAANGWHLEDVFQRWAHKQEWRQPLPLLPFESSI